MKTNKNPFVSIILPTYNREKLIGRSIESILNQTYKNFELIVVDDCSTDNTSTVVNSIIDNRLHYIKLSSNCGPSKARNEGIAIASGEFIAFQDSDDVWHKNKLEKQINIFQKYSDYDLCFCRYEIQNSTKDVWPREETISLSGLKYGMFELLLSGNRIGTPTILVRSKAVRKVQGFNEVLCTLEDWDFALKIAKSWKIYYLNEILLDVYEVQNGINSIMDIRRANVYMHFLNTYWNEYDDKNIFNHIIMSLINNYLLLKTTDQNTILKEMKKKEEIFFYIFGFALQEKNREINVWKEYSQRSEKEWENRCLASEKEWENRCLASEKEWENRCLNTERLLEFERFKKNIIISIIDFFRKRNESVKLYNKIAIYGAGEVSKVFIPLCLNAKITIPFAIDRKPKSIANIPCFIIKNIPDRTIPIIITAYDPERRIKKELEKNVKGEIRYLEDILKNT